MTVKFIIRNLDGSEQFNALTPISRRLGRIQTGTGVSGSFVDPNLSTGTPWWYLTPVSGGSNDWNGRYAVPIVTISGNTISWNAGGALFVTPRKNYYITYGVTA